MNKYHIALIGSILLAAGCVNSATKDIMVDTDADPKADFKGYTSYAWLGAAAIVNDPEGNWEPPEFDADAEIKFLIDRELRKHGMIESATNPDLIVAYAAGIDMAVMEIKIDPESYLETLRNVPMGALIVALIDDKTGLAIWGGVATAEIQESPGLDVVKKANPNFAEITANEAFKPTGVASVADPVPKVGLLSRKRLARRVDLMQLRKDIRIGMRVEAVWRPKEEWDYSLANIKYFKPLDEPDVPFDEIKEYS